MNLLTRLAKAEQAAGVGKLCDWCEYCQEQQRVLIEALQAQSVKLHQPKLANLEYEVCRECGVIKQYDQTFLTKADRREWAALRAEGEKDVSEGRETNAIWWRRYLVAMDRENDAWRKFYGEAYDFAREKTDFEWFRELVIEKLKEAEERKRSEE